MLNPMYYRCLRLCSYFQTKKDDSKDRVTVMNNLIQYGIDLFLLLMTKYKSFSALYQGNFTSWKIELILVLLLVGLHITKQLVTASNNINVKRSFFCDLRKLKNDYDDSSRMNIQSMKKKTGFHIYKMFIIKHFGINLRNEHKFCY